MKMRRADFRRRLSRLLQDHGVADVVDGDPESTSERCGDVSAGLLTPLLDVREVCRRDVAVDRELPVLDAERFTDGPHCRTVHLPLVHVENDREEQESRKARKGR
jgi:hypothetical protein